MEIGNPLKRGSADAGHLAIGGRDQQVGSVWHGAFGIAKEPEEKKRQQDRRHGPQRGSKPRHQRGSAKERKRVIIGVANHSGR